MSRFFSGKCRSQARLDSKTAVITGCNTGIGKITAKDLYIRGARVIMACRDENKALKAMDDIQKECEGMKDLGQLSYCELRLDSLDSVRKCAKHLLSSEDRLNILVNNAGIMLHPHAYTDDGLEMHVGVNHFGHFLFTLLLLPKILQSKPARIINVSSLAHAGGHMDFEDMHYRKRSYWAVGAYNQSKLANILFTYELIRRFKAAGHDEVAAYSLHPGVVKTELGRYMDQVFFRGAHFAVQAFSPFFKTPIQGAQTSIFCSVDESLTKQGGLYYTDCKEANPSRKAKSEKDAKRLWEESLKTVGLENYDVV